MEQPPPPPPPGPGDTPPEQVAQAMDRARHASRLIGDIRLGANRIVEAFLISKEAPELMLAEEAAELALAEDAAMRRHFLDLHAVGDIFAIFRLAVEAFSDQMRHSFPHLPTQNPNKEKSTLADIIKSIETEAPGLTISTYQRLEWLKRAESLASIMDDSSFDQHIEQISPNLCSNFNNVAVIELAVSGIFRVVVSLHSAGSTDPASVAFFSPNEGGRHLHSRGSSVHHIFKHVTEYADMVLQYFLIADPKKALFHLLSWICSHQSLFTKACSKCSRVLVKDKSLGIILPPVHRSYLLTSKGHYRDFATAYHIGCSSYDV